jgi:uncharacterized membrane protein YkvA (DUF1232 family)
MGFLLRLVVMAVLGLVALRRKPASPTVGAIGELDWSRKTSLIWRLVQDKRVPLWARGIAAVPALYVLSPIDILPDFVPFIGRLDDTIIFSLAFDLVARFTPEHVLREHLAQVN